MDIYKIGNKKQVFLLEIPETAVDFFASATSNIENDIIKKARENFEKKLTQTLFPNFKPKSGKNEHNFQLGWTMKGNSFIKQDYYKEKRFKETS